MTKTIVGKGFKMFTVGKVGSESVNCGLRVMMGSTKKSLNDIEPNFYCPRKTCHQRVSLSQLLEVCDDGIRWNIEEEVSEFDIKMRCNLKDKF